MIAVSQSVYLDTGSNTYKLANALTSAATANAAGIALNTTAATGQAITVQTSGVISASNAPFTVGGIVMVSGANNGGLCPSADASTTGWFPCILGIAISTSQLQLGIQ